MKKKVNIYPTVPIYLRPPITGVSYNVEMTEGDIQLCILRRARVEEVLSDGTVLPLNLSNYNTVNERPKIVEEVKEEIKIAELVEEPSVVKEETVIQEDEPVIEEVEVIVEEETVESEKEEISEETIVKEETIESKKEKQFSNQKKYQDKGKNKR